MAVEAATLARGMRRRQRRGARDWLRRLGAHHDAPRQAAADADRRQDRHALCHARRGNGGGRGGGARGRGAATHRSRRRRSARRRRTRRGQRTKSAASQETLFGKDVTRGHGRFWRRRTERLSRKEEEASGDGGEGDGAAARARVACARRARNS